MKTKLTALAIACSMATSVMAEKNPEVDPEWALNTTHKTTFSVSGPAELELDPEWVAIDQDVFQRDGDTITTIAFGNAAMRLAANRVQESIDVLTAQSETKLLSAREELRLLDLEMQLVELNQAMQKSDPPTKLCSGNARFETTYGWFTFAQPFVSMSAQYDEFGPLSPGEKLVESNTYITSPVVGSDYDYGQAIGSGFLIRADSLATIAPTFQCWASSWGYVSVLPFGNQCSETMYYNNSAACNSPAFQ